MILTTVIFPYQAGDGPHRLVLVQQGWPWQRWLGWVACVVYARPGLWVLRWVFQNVCVIHYTTMQGWQWQLWLGWVACFGYARSGLRVTVLHWPWVLQNVLKNDFEVMRKKMEGTSPLMVAISWFGATSLAKLRKKIGWYLNEVVAKEGKAANGREDCLENRIPTVRPLSMWEIMDEGSHVDVLHVFIYITQRGLFITGFIRAVLSQCEREQGNCNLLISLLVLELLFRFDLGLQRLFETAYIPPSVGVWLQETAVKVIWKDSGTVRANKSSHKSHRWLHPSLFSSLKITAITSESCLHLYRNLRNVLLDE